jgi:hypothetical protein
MTATTRAASSGSFHLKKRALPRAGRDGGKAVVIPLFFTTKPAIDALILILRRSAIADLRINSADLG